MFKQKESIEIMRDWINSDIFENILRITNNSNILEKDELDKLNSAVDALKANDTTKHTDAMADLSSVMNKLANNIQKKEFEPIKKVVKHTAFIADELRGEDKELYTNKVGSWLLGIDVIKTTEFFNFKKDNQYSKILNDNIGFYPILFSNQLGNSSICGYLEAIEKRCELEKKTRNKLLDDETKADLKEEMKTTCKSIINHLVGLDNNANKGEYRFVSHQTVVNETNRMENQVTALDNGWDISRLSDVNVIHSVNQSCAALIKLNSEMNLYEIPELKTFLDYNRQLNNVKFVDMNNYAVFENDEVKETIDQDGVDKCYIEFFDIMKKLNAEAQKPEVRETVSKLVDMGIIPQNSNDLLTGMVNQDSKYGFALENTYLGNKTYLPLDMEKGAMPAPYNKKLHNQADLKLIDSFKESVDDFVKEAKEMYKAMRELTRNHSKSSPQFRKMEQALAMATTIKAEEQSPEEILKIMDDLAKAGDTYVTERGKKANSERLGLGKKIAAFAKGAHFAAKEHIKDTFVEEHDNMKVVDLEGSRGRNVDNANSKIRDNQLSNIGIFYNKVDDLKSDIYDSMYVFSNKGVDHKNSNNASPTFKQLYDACSFFSAIENIGDKKPDDVVEALKKLAKAADDYDKAHSGITNLNKGVSKEGRERLNAARQISKEIKKQLNTVIEYRSKLHGIKENETLKHYNNRTKLEKENYTKPANERLTDKQIEEEIIFQKNYKLNKTIKNEIEYQKSFRKYGNTPTKEIVVNNIAALLLAEKHGEKALLNAAEYEEKKKGLNKDDLISEIISDESLWNKENKLDAKKALEKYKSAVIEREAQKKAEELKKQEEPEKKNSNSINVINEEPKKKNSNSINIINEEPKKKNSNSINIINEEPKKKNSNSINIINEEPKKKNSNSINIINEEPKKKNSNSINIINEEPKKNAEKKKAPKKQELVFDEEKAKNSPFYSSQRMINSIINYAPPKSQKEFETLREHMILRLSEIVAKTVVSAMESKEFNKAEFISQYTDSEDFHIDENMMLKQVANSEPMQSLEKEITSWEELVKLGKSALSENAQPFLMNYGIRNHKSFENSRNKTADKTNQKRLRNDEKEIGGSTPKPTNFK